MLTLSSFGQENKKFEKEYRLDPGEVPEKALTFMNPEHRKVDIRWYFEENLYDNAVEVKFKRQGNWYSVEFDTAGSLEDIEIEFEFNSIGRQIRNKIRATLDTLFAKRKIRKVQWQYTGEIVSFDDFLAARSENKISPTGYELVVKGKRDKVWQLYEIFFDAKGNRIRTSKIISGDTTNLEF